MTQTISPNLSLRQKQIVIGTILGGSSLVLPQNGKNSYLSMRDKNEHWLRFKASELSIIASNKCFIKGRTNRWHSQCYPFLNDLREVFYKNKTRKLNFNWLKSSNLTDIAFGTWFGDCGSYNKNTGEVCLNTSIWGEDGSADIAKLFKWVYYDATLKKIKNGYRVILDENSSCDFLKMISPHFSHILNFGSEETT